MPSQVATVRQARKAHRCLWCGERIDRGETYVEVRWANEDRHGLDRYHRECHEAEDRAHYEDLDWWTDEHCIPKFIRGGTILEEQLDMEIKRVPVVAVEEFVAELCSACRIKCTDEMVADVSDRWSFGDAEDTLVNPRDVMMAVLDKDEKGPSLLDKGQAFLDKLPKDLMVGLGA